MVDMRAGRHSRQREWRMKVISEGVKGLLRTRRESFVVCALRIAEASERSARAFGGLGLFCSWFE